jgi:hypothetical protein
MVSAAGSRLARLPARLQASPGAGADEIRAGMQRVTVPTNLKRG